MLDLMKKRTDRFILSTLRKPKELPLWQDMRALNLMADDFVRLIGGKEVSHYRQWRKYGGNVLNAPLRQCAKIRHLTDKPITLQERNGVFFFYDDGAGEEPAAYYARYRESPVWFVFMDESLLFGKNCHARYRLHLSMPELFGNQSHLSVAVNGEVSLDDVLFVVRSVRDNEKAFKRRRGSWLYQNGRWEKQKSEKPVQEKRQIRHPVLKYLSEHPEIPRYEQFLFFCLSQGDFSPPLNQDRQAMENIRQDFEKA